MRTGFIWVVAVSLILGVFVTGDFVLAADVMVDGAQRYQTIEGFGTCLIAWSGRFRELYRTEEFQKIYVEGVTGSYVKMIKDNPGALAALDVFASHGYEDGVKAEMSATSSRRFWDLIKDTGKPFWITEGGTGGHDWPEPIQNGIGNALHNALAAGNCSAFVPWQITENRKSTHGIMLMSRYTPKTYTAMHYSRFIRPGAVRIDARPGFGDVQVGAFVHEGRGELAIVAINPTGQEQPLSLNFNNLKAPASLEAVRTSASENMQQAGQVTVNDNKAAFRMMSQSIVTLSGKIR